MTTPDSIAPARPLSRMAISKGAKVIMLFPKERNEVPGEVK